MIGEVTIISGSMTISGAISRPVGGFTISVFVCDSGIGIGSSIDSSVITGVGFCSIELMTALCCVSPGRNVETVSNVTVATLARNR